MITVSRLWLLGGDGMRQQPDRLRTPYAGLYPSAYVRGASEVWPWPSAWKSNPAVTQRENPSIHIGKTLPIRDFSIIRDI
jgi:hypothetical protein